MRRPRFVTLARRGNAHRARGEYAAAGRLLRRALAGAERAFGPPSVEVATALNDLGVVYKYQARLDEARPLYRR
ncbi:MAG TPA: tetratricopeptide repeat protein, partial [Vicinamibacteria bacterium]|nr:tetratricopeptide repeat protein [Vicinamibacteria bacterium]